MTRFCLHNSQKFGFTLTYFFLFVKHKPSLDNMKFKLQKLNASINLIILIVIIYSCWVVSVWCFVSWFISRNTCIAIVCTNILNKYLWYVFVSVWCPYPLLCYQKDCIVKWERKKNAIKAVVYPGCAAEMQRFRITSVIAVVNKMKTCLKSWFKNY